MDTFSVPRHEVELLLRRADSIGLSRTARLRLQWLLYAINHNGNVSLTCRHFGIARGTFLRWAARFDPSHPETLEDQSRRPHRFRQPETTPGIVRLIERYRRQFPFMNKHKIQEALLREYGIVLSSSTVGRVIARHKFFFADSETHRQKRDVCDEIAGSRTPGNSPFLGGALAAVIAFVVIVCGSNAPIASAAQSPSYTLYSTFPNDATTITKRSPNYQLTEGGITWNMHPLTSPNYQLRGALAGDGSSTASSQSSSGTSGGTNGGGTGGGGGGRRSDSSKSKSSTPARSSHAPHPAAAASSASITSTTTTSQRSLGLSDAISEFQGGNRSAVMPTNITPAAISGALSTSSPGYARCLGGAVMSLIVAFGTIALGATIGAFVVLCWRWVARALFSRRRWFLGMRRREREEDNPEQKNRSQKKRSTTRRPGALAILFVGVALWSSMPIAYASTVGPTMHVYNGRLLNGEGAAVTTAQSVRFSYWNSEDYQSGDITGTGAINSGASNYADWYEVHTVTPDSNGYFSVELGSISSLPSVASYSPGDLADLFLQVEVKESAAADTGYELLDTNSTSSAVDRSPVLSVPFALNADRIDQRDVGTGSGSVPVLGSGGVLPVAEVPGATNKDSFTLDDDNSGTTEISLQFGQALAKKLSYDILNSRFNFNASLRVQGDLTVTGLINGVDITDLSGSTDTYLKASSGAGLSLQVGGGSYRINGFVTNFAGSGNVALRANATQNVYFTGTGLTVTTGDFPTDKSFISVAQVTTNAGAITTIDDRRVLSSDDREQTIEKMFTPAFEHASFQGDASNNVGQLSMSHDNVNNHNFYLWTSTKMALQDYDVFVRVPLPSDFEHWDSSAPLVIGYRSTSASALNNTLTVQVYDTNGQPVSLGGSTSGLASASWTTSDITFSGGTWAAGQEFLIKFTLQAKDDYQIHLGKMRLKYVGMIN